MILPFHLLMYNPLPPPSPLHPRPQHVLDCEFYLLEMMDCCLIVHQPYRPLTTYAESLGPEVTSSHHIRHTSHTPCTSHTPHMTYATHHGPHMIRNSLYNRHLKLCFDLQVLNTAWHIVNDSLRCDAVLLYPPHLIALSGNLSIQ